MMKKIQYILAEIGQCAGVDGCQHAPRAIADSLAVVADNVAHTVTAQNPPKKNQRPKNHPPKTQSQGLDATPNLIDFASRQADAVAQVRASGYFPIVIGGDHSCAMGTFAGAVNPDTDFGLIWIDAHFDLHTPQSSDSGNMHGMPVATLMGYGVEDLVNTRFDGAKIKPENVIFIGIRSFESPEQKLAKKLGIKVFYVDDVHEQGFQSCFKQAVLSLQHRNIPFGISFDMDSLDVSEITALGTPVENGLMLNDVMDGFLNTDLTGLEIFEVVEYNPTLDTTGNDYIAVQKILSCFDRRIHLPQMLSHAS